MTLPALPLATAADDPPFRIGGMMAGAAVLLIPVILVPGPNNEGRHR